VNAGDLKVGLVGCGRISQAAHLPALAKADYVRLCGVCDPSPSLSEAMARRYGAPSYTEFSDLLDSDVEALILAVPDRFHVPLTLTAIEAGKHVLVEKPIATSVLEAETLSGALMHSGMKLQVGNMKRYDPGVQFAAAAIKSGQIGKVQSVTCWYRLMAALRRPVEATVFPPMVIDETVRQQETELKMANREKHLLATLGVHTFDLVRFLVGEYAVCSAELATQGTDYSWHGLMRFETGGIGSFEVSAGVHAEWAEGFEIYGSRGHISIQLPYTFFRQASAVKLFDEPSAISTVPVFSDTDPYERQIEAFAASVLNDTPTSPGLEDGIAALRIVDAVHAAVAQRGADSPDGMQITLYEKRG
jgi:predicted dehydrogenase